LEGGGGRKKEWLVNLVLRSGVLQGVKRSLKRKDGGKIRDDHKIRAERKMKMDVRGSSTATSLGKHKNLIAGGRLAKKGGGIGKGALKCRKKRLTENR